ncbi:MAG TPA: hypothetical protein VFN67_07805 [Polyangiales bacterium]|nr:hypothetical protein [Polyangiales bacterium]
MSVTTVATACLSMRPDERDADVLGRELGIDWRKVREKALAQGLPHETQADLEAATFSDGISTKDEASEVSGRGVGMGALKQTCESLHGTLTLHSEFGRGTRSSLRVPLSAATTRTAAA